MPKLYITEFAGGMTYPVSNAPAPAAALPAAGTQVVSFTSASTQSLALGATTRLVRLNTDAPCHILANALQDYILYRAYTKDSEYAGNAQRAVNHYTAFMNALGVEIKATLAVAPTTQGNPNHPGASATGPKV